jgi:hypothetical protein
VIALEWLLEAIPATAVNTAGQQPPVAALSELSTALRQVATAAAAAAQADVPWAVSDAVRSIQDAVARMRLKSSEPSTRHRDARQADAAVTG